MFLVENVAVTIIFRYPLSFNLRFLFLLLFAILHVCLCTVVLVIQALGPVCLSNLKTIHWVSLGHQKKLKKYDLIWGKVRCQHLSTAYNIAITLLRWQLANTSINPVQGTGCQKADVLCKRCSQQNLYPLEGGIYLHRDKYWSFLKRQSRLTT